VLAIIGAAAWGLAEAVKRLPAPSAEPNAQSGT